jgi:putative protease
MSLEKKIPELLAPAGDIERLKTAALYGADAIYIGGKNFSLRAKAINFTPDDMLEGIIYAHERGVKVYVTVNIFAHNKDFQGLYDYLSFLDEIKVDAIIVSDPGILSLVLEKFPNLNIHLSTQANVTNLNSARFWEKQGVKRLNLARELSFNEISVIKNAAKAEVEVFVHGAICISYSGRCFLSLYLTDRDANKGECAQPCRYHYRLEERKRPGEYLPIEEDDRGAYIFHSKDMCLLRRLPQLISIGIDSIKIEGRMKSHYYIASVTRLYRAAIDYWKNHEISQNPVDNTLPEIFFNELNIIGTRSFTENFFEKPPNQGDMLYDLERVENNYVFAGIVEQEGENTLIKVKNKIKCNDELEYMKKGLDMTSFRIISIYDIYGNEIKESNPEQIVKIFTEPSVSFEKYSILRKKKF